MVRVYDVEGGAIRHKVCSVTHPASLLTHALTHSLTDWRTCYWFIPYHVLPLFTIATRLLGHLTTHLPIAAQGVPQAPSDCGTAQRRCRRADRRSRSGAPSPAQLDAWGGSLDAWGGSLDAWVGSLEA